VFAVQLPDLVALDAPTQFAEVGTTQAIAGHAMPAAHFLLFQTPRICSRLVSAPVRVLLTNTEQLQTGASSTV
jgi:hypothetical protein